MMKKSPSLLLHQLQSRSSCPQNRCSPHREQYRSLLKHCVLHRCLVCSTCSPVWERKRTKWLVCSPDLTWQEIPGDITVDPFSLWCPRQWNSWYSGQGGIKKRASEQVNHTERSKNSNKSKTKFKVDARTPATQQKRPLSPVISARTGDNFPP